MAVINAEMYEALLVAKVPEGMARAAAAQVAVSQDFASRSDLLEFGKELRSAIDRRFAEQDKRFAEQDKRFVEQDKRFVEQDKRFGAIEKSLAVLRFAVLSGGSVMLGLLLKLVFFP